MSPTGFIAGRLRFRGRLACAAIAVSFFVIIIAVAVSDGFKAQVRSGVASLSGDVMLTSSAFDWYGSDNPVSSVQSYMDDIASLPCVDSISEVVYRAGIARGGSDIEGVVIKGVHSVDSSLHVRIPASLSSRLCLKEGDAMPVYFIGERTKVRKFIVEGIYDSIVGAGNNPVVFAPIDDVRRLNGWNGGLVSAFEVMLKDSYRSDSRIREASMEIGAIASMCASGEDDALVASSSVDRYPRLFDWLSLIGFNVRAILILMIVVAGFNMISGLLILLFRNISTIGTLKALGMTDRGIAGVFLRVSARLTLYGMAVGNAAALLFCLFQSLTHAIKLNPVNYFVSFVPVSVNLPAVLFADLFAFLGIMFLTLVPTLFISKVDPCVTVKSE